MSQTRDMDVAMGLGNSGEPVDVTIILPAFNEEDSIEGIYSQVKEVFEPEDLSYEVLFVDDGSTDCTWKRIEELCARDRRVHALRHRRNYGKASALANGFRYARGEIMVTSDADMQYEPKDMVRLVEKIHEGYDVVSAYKVIRRDPLSKRIPSKFFNNFVRGTTGVQLHDFNAGLKAYRHAAAEDLIRFGYGELHRFFILIAARRGFCVAEIPVESLHRVNGKSKYGMERYLRGALDYLTVFFLSGYAERPLHLFGSISVVLVMAGFATIAYVGIATLFQLLGARSTSLLIAGGLFIVSGLQLLVLGLIAEMINNLERRDAGAQKISQVLRIDRRTSVVLAPGVQVDRRRDDERDLDSAPAPAVNHRVERR